jgi:hypothetical protein
MRRRCRSHKRTSEFHYHSRISRIRQRSNSVRVQYTCRSVFAITIKTISFVRTMLEAISRPFWIVYTHSTNDNISSHHWRHCKGKPQWWDQCDDKRLMISNGSRTAYKSSVHPSTEAMTTDYEYEKSSSYREEWWYRDITVMLSWHMPPFERINHVLVVSFSLMIVVCWWYEKVRRFWPWVGYVSW